MQKIFTVEGMSCGHCKSAVEKAAKAVAGVQMAQVDLAAKTLTVDFDGVQATIDTVIEAVDDAGFTVVL